LLLLGACNLVKYKSVPIALDVKQALTNKKTFDIEQEAKQIDFVALETREDCLVGELRKVVKNRDYLFVADMNSNLFLFTSQGKFLRKIGATGQGKGEYAILADFDVDRKTNDIYINAGGKLLVYSIGGTFLKSINLGSSSLQVFCLNQNGWAMNILPDAPSEEGVDSVALVEAVNLQSGKKECVKSGVVRRTGFPFFGWIYSKENFTYYKPELGNCIYRLNESNQKSKFLELEFGDLAFTENLFDFGANQKWNSHYRVKNFMVFKDKFMINLQKGLMGEELLPLIYDKQKGDFFFPQNTAEKEGLYFENISLQPLADEEENLICSMSIPEIIESKNTATNQEFRKIARDVNKNSNPVFVICKF
jgi:hypothetical protein